VVEVVEHAETKVPVIVVSRTGDWPEYLTAIRNGYLTTWLTRLFLESRNASSEMLFWSANRNNISKAFKSLICRREEEKWHEQQTDNGSSRG
jgi:hypothetical protein